MRIISGSARGRKLAVFPGQSIRPTPDRVREAVFSMLYSRMGSLEGLRVLDLFAGTGAMGLEALSRGSREAWLVDRDRRAEKVIRQNLSACHLQERGRIVSAELPGWLDRLSPGEVFDLVFLDPPYNQGLAHATLVRLGDLPEPFSEELVVVAETDRHERLDERYGRLLQRERRQYGTTAIHIYTADTEGQH